MYAVCRDNRRRSTVKIIIIDYLAGDLDSKRDFLARGPYIEIASWQIMQKLTMYMYVLHCYIHTYIHVLRLKLHKTGQTSHQLMIHVGDMEIKYE